MAETPEDRPDPQPRRGSRPAPIIDLPAAEVGAATEPSAAADPPAGESVEPERPVQRPRPRGVALPSFAWGAAGGFAAGAIVAGLVLAYANPDDVRDTDAALLQGLAQRLTRLEQRPAAAPATRPEDLAAIAGKLAEQERAVADRLAVLEKAVADAAAAAAAPMTAAAPVAAAEPAAPSAMQPASQPAAEVPAERLAALEAAARAARDAAVQATAAAAQAEARARAAEAAPRLAPDALAPVAEAVRAVQDRLAAIGDVAARLQALETRPGPVGPNRATAWPVALAALRDALGDGRPFARELAAAKALAGPAAGRLEVLAPYADGGLPTTAGLAARFAKALPDLLKAAPRGDAEGFLDRLTRNAEGLVRVRPTGEAGGDDAVVLIGRAEARLKAGDLAGALDAADRWPPAVKAAAAAWLAVAGARRDADRLIDDLSAEALAALGATRG